ncbi:MAG: GTP cyclohydrolase I FolE [Gammaproteobacteria bacterium]|nr:GTP cyclohydrolase I FolE [Gammaproteobacteria bacterium]
MDPITKAYRVLIEHIGEDPDRDGLVDTPNRAARAIKFLTKGYHEDIGSIVNNALYQSNIDEIIIVKDIELYSLCEHHILPFIGKCHVGYLPHGKVLGLSKIARIVDMFARRLQIQERLTQDVAQTIMNVTEASGVGVLVEAQHLCMQMRGVEKQHSMMKTSVLLGSFREDPATRAEFLQLID